MAPKMKDMSEKVEKAAKGAREGGAPGVGGHTPKDDMATTSKTSEVPLSDVSLTPKAAAVHVQQEKDVEKMDVHPLPPPESVVVYLLHPLIYSTGNERTHFKLQAA